MSDDDPQGIGDDPCIPNSEIMWRRVSHAVPDENLGRQRPSSASFLQDGPDGPVSVYLASEALSAEAVHEEGKEPFLVALAVGFVRQIGLGVRRDKSSGGSGHAAVIGRKTGSKRDKMAKEATWVEPYAPQ